MRFSEMPYARPDAAALQEKLRSLTKALREADSFERAEAVYLENEAAVNTFETMATLSHIRHDIDTRDAFYDGENDFFDEVGPTLQEPMQEWTMALLESPFRPQFEAKYGRLPFVNAELDLKTFSPEIIPELQDRKRPNRG